MQILRDNRCCGRLSRGVLTGGCFSPKIIISNDLLLFCNDVSMLATANELLALLFNQGLMLCLFG